MKAQIPAGERTLVLVLAAIQFTHIMDFMIMMPLGPQLMRVMLISPQQFGILVSAYTLTAAVAALAVAFYTDRFDRRQTLLFLYAGFVISTLLCGIAPGYNELLTARAVAGAFGGVAGATVHSIIGDAIPENRRGAATGMIMSAFALSSIIGVPIGLVLAAHFSWRAPFLLLVAVSVLVFLLTWRILPPMRSHIVAGEAHRPLEQMRSVLGTANHLRAFVFMFALMFAGFSVIPFISPYMVANVGLKETDLPYLYLFGGLATVFSSRYIGNLADRYRMKATADKAQPDKWVFARTDGSGLPLWDSGVRQALKKAAAADGCDFPGLGPHSLRRAYITWVQEAGGSSIEASKMAGHSTVRMTEGYTKIQLNRQADLTRRIQERLASAGERLSGEHGADSEIPVPPSAKLAELDGTVAGPQTIH